MSLMHELKKKKSSHYFSHVEDGGKKKHVYLGVDRKKALERLAFLRSERIRSHDKHMRRIDELQSRLEKLAEYHKDPDELISDAKKRHYRSLHAENLLDQSRPEKLSLPEHHFFPTFITILIVVLLSSAMFLFAPQLEVTGHAVTEYVDQGKFTDFSSTKESWGQAWDAIRSPSNSAISFITLAVCVAALLAAFFGRVEYKHHNRYEEFKHPLMRNVSKRPKGQRDRN